MDSLSNLIDGVGNESVRIQVGEEERVDQRRFSQTRFADHHQSELEPCGEKDNECETRTTEIERKREREKRERDR